MKLQDRAEMLGEKTFLGVPVRDFQKGGREQLIYVLNAGLNPNSKVIDIGCGVLRGGYWLIHFLDRGCYCGIEPHAGRLEMGINTILGPEMLEAKRPRFDTNPDFDTSVFGEKFDFFLAYSIWTHASKRQIQTMLDSFLRDAKDDGVFLTSYLPAGGGNPDYQSDKWNGTSHESDVPGCIYHSLRWIKAECDRRALVVRELGRDKCCGQSWIEITRHKRVREPGDDDPEEETKRFLSDDLGETPWQAQGLGTHRVKHLAKSMVNGALRPLGLKISRI